MKIRANSVREDAAKYYAKHSILGEIEEMPVEFALDGELRRQILGGK
jgi:hypothetical protein